MALDPVVLFREWFEEAHAAGIEVPEAMTLATADAEGRPSARMVLLKSADDDGFTFFTGYESRKGQELAENARAALVFYWRELGRQVRVEGPVRKLAAEESDAYWQTRPVRSLAISVLPEPRKRSSTESPTWELFSTTRSTNARGFIVGCRSDAEGRSIFHTSP